MTTHIWPLAQAAVKIIGQPLRSDSRSAFTVRSGANDANY